MSVCCPGMGGGRDATPSNINRNAWGCMSCSVMSCHVTVPSQEINIILWRCRVFMMLSNGSRFYFSHLQVADAV